ncbi:MAG: PilZ domain-containing protein [Synergistaceae bacterium]|nr:PilZ domain-containing protein [Synergistaceae bacterium]
MQIDEMDATALDYFSKLRPGKKGEIAINAGIYKGHYPTYVDDVTPDSVAMAHPIMKGALLPAYRDMNFTLTLEDGGALYVFDMSVRRVETQSGSPTLWASINGLPKRIQRRQFLRMSCLWDILVFHLENEAARPMSTSWLSAKAVDISLGGYRFVAGRSLVGDSIFELGDSMLVRFELASAEQMQTGRITRVTRKGDILEVGVGFDALPASVEKKLFEYIRQQEILSKDSDDDKR